MRTLVLLRHGKSAYPEGVADHDRPLNARGERDATRAGELLAASHVFDLVLVSSALRAQQTWERVGASVPSTVPGPRADLYLATSDELVTSVRALSGDVRSALVVGHNPGLEDCATALSGVPTELKTSTFAVLTSDEPWASWRPGSARLDAVVVARG